VATRLAVAREAALKVDSPAAVLKVAVKVQVGSRAVQVPPEMHVQH